MTYTIQAPNAAVSPGLFPSQANTNFQRLFDIINNDHIFNFSSPGASPNNDGTHRQVTFTNLAATPSALPTGTNSILYAKAVGIASQLFFWNGATDQQITPAVTINASGTANLDVGQTSVIFTANYDFVAYGIAYINGTTDFTASAMIRSGGSANSTDLAVVTGIPNFVISSGGALPANATVSITNAGIVPGAIDIVGALYIIRL